VISPVGHTGVEDPGLHGEFDGIEKITTKSPDAVDADITPESAAPPRGRPRTPTHRAEESTGTYPMTVITHPRSSATPPATTERSPTTGASNQHGGW
jgi:hypothetical protein